MNTTIYKIEWGTFNQTGEWRPEGARYFSVGSEEELRQKLNLPPRDGSFGTDPNNGKLFTIGGVRVENV